MVGSAGSFPGPSSPASCYLVEAEGPDAVGQQRTWRILLDLGNGALGPLQRYADPLTLDAVLLSHLHPDHYLDLCGLYVMHRYHPGRGGEGGNHAPRTRVYGPQGTAVRLAAAYDVPPPPRDDEGLSGSFDIRTWSPDRPERIGPFTATPITVRHPVPAFGLRVIGPSEAHADQLGSDAIIAYTGDTDECEGLDVLAAGAHVLLAEASFVSGRDDEHTGVHLTGHQAGKAAANGGVGLLVLTHIPAWNSPQTAQREAEQVFDGPIELARPGLVVIV